MNKFIKFYKKNKNLILGIGSAVVIIAVIVAFPSIYETGKDFGRSIVNGLMP